MAKSPKTKDSTLPKSLRSGALPKPVGDVLAAGLGALSAAQKKGSDSFDALVSLGGGVVDKGSDAARAAVEQVESAAGALTKAARGVAGGAAETVSGGVETVVEAALERLGVPGREEIVALQAQVEALEARIAALRAEGKPAQSASVTVYEVRSHENGWAVQRVGAGRASAVHATKKEAIRDARQTAKAHAPSRLTVYKADGTVADGIEYAAE